MLFCPHRVRFAKMWISMWTNVLELWITAQLFSLEVCDDQMLSMFVVTLLKVDQVFFMKRAADVEPTALIKLENSGCILDDKHKFCLAVVKKIISKPLLVVQLKFVLRVGAEFTIVGWIKENKVVLARSMFLQKSLEI